MGGDENQHDVTIISNIIFNFATMLIQDGHLHVQLYRAVNEAPKLCPNHTQYVGSDNYEKVAYLPFEVFHCWPHDSMRNFDCISCIDAASKVLFYLQI